jgi:anti-anti-sigma regulatory factor
LSLQVEQGVDRRLVRLEESITVNTAAELHQLLLEAVRSKQHLGLDLERVIEVDVCAIQLFYAARLAAERSGLSLSVSSIVQEPVQRAFRDAGLDPFGSPSDQSKG